MKLKDTRTLQERADDLEKVYTFSIVATAKKYYKTVDNFKTIYKKIVNGNATTEEQIDFCNRFGHKPAEYRKILGQLNGKRVKIADVTQYFSNWFHYQRHFNKNYKKSGKTYAVHGYWYIDFDVLKRYVNDNNILNTNSNFYSKRQHTYIDNIILKYKKENIMTKKQKEQYQKEYDEGKHALTLEQFLKQEQKKKKAIDKHRMTIAKKAAKQTLAEYAKLQMENEMLKNEIARPKMLKDDNSDIVEQKHLYEYDELNEAFPDGMELEDIEKCSEACKKRLEEEANKQQSELHNRNIDINSQIEYLKNLQRNNEFKDDINKDIEEAIEADDKAQKLIDKAYKKIASLVATSKLSYRIANLFAEHFNKPMFQNNFWTPTTKNEYANCTKEMNELISKIRNNIKSA